MLILLISLLISGNCGAVSLKLRYERDQFATETIEPEILVSRVPLHTFVDFDSYIKKLITYERNGNYSDWSNTILFAGSKLSDSDQYDSPDTYYISQWEYNNSIKPYWQGNIRNIFHNPNDAFNSKKGSVTPSLLQKELSKSFLIADVNCHGTRLSWLLDNGSFESDNISIINNPHYYCIISQACHTNYYGFTSTDKKGIVGGDVEITSPPELSLAEVFLRSSKSGAIGYLGNTRQGWGSDTIKSYGASDKLNNEIYNNIFSKKISDSQKALMRPERNLKQNLILKTHSIG